MINLKNILTKSIQLGLGPLIALSLGVVSNKLIAIYLPEVYLGYYGLTKSLVFFISSLLLFGLNHSYFFLERERILDSREMLNSTCVLIIAFGFIAIFISLLIFYPLIEEVTFIASLFALLIAGVHVIYGIYAKSDSVDDDFSKYPFYTSIQPALLFVLVVSFIFLGGVKPSLFVVFLIVLVLFFCVLKVYGFSRVDLVSLKCLFVSNLHYAKYFYVLLLVSTGYIAFIQWYLNKVGAAVEFNVVLSISALLSIVNLMVCNYLAPRLSKIVHIAALIMR